MINVLYLAHDLADPAVARRILMLEAGGASVTPAGFRRGNGPAGERLGAAASIELGKTRDGGLAHRALAVANASLTLSGKLSGILRPDVILARNLEMLAVANRARAIFGSDVPLVYECLDIHRLLLRKDAVGRLMRSAEGYFGRDAQLLITSSPAFVENYFRPLSHIDCAAHLLENKLLVLDEQTSGPVEAAQPPLDGEPWKIGWFGALRCRKSLQLLADFSRRMEGRFEIVLRGRPAYSEFDDFDWFVRNEPYMTFHGPYRYPDEISDIYREVHYTWAIDFFEEGQNSSWLLPNRLYEGCHQGRPPIALRGTQTARFLADRGLGVILDRASRDQLLRQIGTIDAGRYTDIARSLSDCSPATWTCDREQCEALVARLATLTPEVHGARIRPSPTNPRYNEGGVS